MPEDFNLDEVIGVEVSVVCIDQYNVYLTLDRFHIQVLNGYVLSLEDKRTESWKQDDLTPIPTLLGVLLGKALKRWRVDDHSSVHLEFSGGAHLELTTNDPHCECLVISYGIPSDPQYVI